MELDFAWWYPVKKQKAVGKNWNITFYNYILPVYCKGQALEHVAQRDCGGSIVGNFQTLGSVLDNLLY